VLEVDAFMIRHRDHWLVRETIAALRRAFARLDVSARSIYAIVDEGSCFAGLLFEFALAADRSYMLSLFDDGPSGPVVALDDFNFGLLPMINGQSRLGARFHNDPAVLNELMALKQKRLPAAEAVSRGLVTIASDELDWEDEIRIALEERASLSPDALSGMEASLRFSGPESLHSKIFARLSAWQNWIFNRPNATGEQGSLKLFGSGSKPRFDWERV
jgi:benzoyl-CoA-dihydrodiol lyase